MSGNRRQKYNESDFARVMRKARETLSQARESNLTSVAKAIEKRKSCRIFFEPYPNGGWADETSAFLVTIPTLIIADDPNLKYPAPGFQAMNCRDHWIFYRPNPKNREQERCAIAHELAHCLFHWPLDKALAVEAVEINDCYIGYKVAFTRAQENEANAFACIVAKYWPIPERPNHFPLDRAFYEAVDMYFRNGYLALPQ